MVNYFFNNGSKVNVGKNINIDAKGMSEEQFSRLIDQVVNGDDKSADVPADVQRDTETAEMTETRTLKVTRPVGTRSKMELLVRNHPDPAAFIAQLKLDVAACDKPKEKMRVVLQAIEAGNLPEDLPYPVFCEEIEYIAQTTFSNWLNSIKNE